VTTHRPRVLLTRPINATGLTLLEPAADVAVASATDHDTLRREAASADAIIVLGAYLPADICEHAPRLLGCIRCGAGVDLIPVDEVTACGVIVANVPGVNAPTVAEYCIAQFLLHARNIARIDRTDRKSVV
jgi:D-3-phosphoglycerate dehydrogenase